MADQKHESEWLEFSLIVDQDQVRRITELLTGLISTNLVTERIYDGLFPHELENTIVPVRIYGYLPIDDQIDSQRSNINSALEILSPDLSLIEPTYTPLVNQDWATAWQEGYEPIPLGKRLIVVPNWLDNPQPERLEIKMDPGMAFGSGTHPTTQLSLIMLENCLAEMGYQEMIDIGSGSGILAIAGSKLGVQHVLGVDNDPEVIRIAAVNASHNQVIGKIDFQLGSVEEILSGIFSLTEAPLVVANIIAPILTGLFHKGMADIISPGGNLLLSGILTEQLPDILNLLKDKQLILREQNQEEDWIALWIEKPSN